MKQTSWWMTVERERVGWTRGSKVSPVVLPGTVEGTAPRPCLAHRLWFGTGSGGAHLSPHLMQALLWNQAEHIVLSIKTFVGFFSQRIINCQSSERCSEINGENSKFVNEEINPKTGTLILTLINYRRFFVIVLLSLNIAATVVEPLFKCAWLIMIFILHSRFPLPQ